MVRQVVHKVVRRVVRRLITKVVSRWTSLRNHPADHCRNERGRHVVTSASRRRGNLPSLAERLSARPSADRLRRRPSLPLTRPPHVLAVVAMLRAATRAMISAVANCPPTYHLGAARLRSRETAAMPMPMPGHKRRVEPVSGSAATGVATRRATKLVSAPLLMMFMTPGTRRRPPRGVRLQPFEGMALAAHQWRICRSIGAHRQRLRARDPRRGRNSLRQPLFRELPHAAASRIRRNRCLGFTRVNVV